MTFAQEVQETILVVEDDVLVRMPIAHYLRDCGYKVVEAANADEAVTVLSHKETIIDLVFTDIEMPGALDGFGLAQWVREHRPGLDVILAGTLPRTVETAKKLCEESPIPKPYDAQIVPQSLPTCNTGITPTHTQGGGFDAFHAFAHRTPRSDGAVALSGSFSKLGAGVVFLKSPSGGGPISLVVSAFGAGRSVTQACGALRTGSRFQCC
jgi:CheY-like chemotaxis protein